jgi:hypothetical protein
MADNNPKSAKVDVYITKFWGMLKMQQSPAGTREYTVGGWVLPERRCEYLWYPLPVCVIALATGNRTPLPFRGYVSYH